MMHETTTETTTDTAKPEESSADKVLAIASELAAARRQLRADDARKMREAQLADEERERARKAAEPAPPPLPEPIARMLEQDAALEAYLAGSAHLDPEIGQALAGIGYRRRTVEREQVRRHRAELAKAAHATAPEVYRLSPTMRGPDDVMVVGADAFAFGGFWEREGQRARRVAMPGAFGFASREDWDSALRELHERSRAEYLARKRSELERVYSGNPEVIERMAELQAATWARDADREVGFVIVGEERFDLPKIARRFYGLDAAFPLAPQSAETAKACGCTLTRVRWALVARQRGAKVETLESWIRDEQGRVSPESGVSVDAALAFWSDHDRRAREAVAAE